MSAVFEGISLKTMEFSITIENENKFNNIKVVKFKNELQPFVMVKNTILNQTDIPSWNTRELMLFNFEGLAATDTNRVGKIFAQYTPNTITDTSFDFSSYTIFKILKIKNMGGSALFKNLQQPITLYDVDETSATFGQAIGTQLENINITRDSFNPLITPAIINYIEKSNYFMFGFKCTTTKNVLYDTAESSSVQHVFDNMVYVFENNFTTGFSSLAVQTDMTFRFLMTNTEEITLLNTTPNVNYQVLINNSETGNIIPSNHTSTITLFVKISGGITNSKINLRFSSNDIMFNTFVPTFKQIGNTSYLLSSQPSGLNPDLYMFNVSVFKISAVDRITRSTTSVISLNGNREIEIFMEPDLKTDYFSGINSIAALKININNQNPSIFDMANEVQFPDISGSNVNNTVFTITSTSNPDNLNNLLLVSFSITTDNPLFQGITIPDISIQVASIVCNTTKTFINTAGSLISYKPSVVVSTAPGTLQDLSSATLIGVNQQQTITPQTYNFTVKIVDNEFVIEYQTDLQVESIIRRFSNINDISFNAYENDIYIFDTSHSSNTDHLLTFFTSSTINGNNELLGNVTYDDNINQGNTDSKITLVVPSYSTYTTIYIADFPSGQNQQNKLNGKCKINILSNPTDISLGTFNFTQLIGDGTSIMSLVPALDENNIPVQGINKLDFDIDTTTTDATRVLELFSGEKTPIPQILVYSIYLSKPLNLTFNVFNKNLISLMWNLNNNSIYPFANPRESRFTISVYYNIYREESDTNNITFIGTSLLNTFIDRNTINFNNYNYYVESVATWEGMTLTSERSDPLFVFVCENNRFPNGRWNNSFSNPKLYKQVSTCSNRNNITTNLFPNSWSLSKKETYARLSNLPISKR